MVVFLGVAFVFYIVALLMQFYATVKPVRIANVELSDISKYLITAGFVSHTVALIIRTYLTGHAPMSDMFETIIFYSWSATLATVIIVYRYKERTIELITMPVALLALGVSFFVVSPGKPLTMVLRTWWFETHVMSSFAAYALFTVAFASAVLYLVIRKLGTTGVRIETFQEIMGRSVLWGFFLFSLSMFLAAIWSYLAWGSYWLWDAKVIWSFIVWFYYGGAIHAWFVKGWRGRAFAIASIIGFFVVLFTYLGVSLLMKSTHSF